MANNDKNTFQNKIVLISGAGRGFGFGAAQHFYERGANLVLTDLNDEMLRAAVEKLGADDSRVATISGDISLEETSQKTVELATSKFGGLDIALNNAGILQPNVRLHELDSETAQAIMQVDLMGVFFAMKHQLPAMAARHSQNGSWCNIINTASAAGLMGSPKLSVYAAAKHGVVGLTRSAAVEYAGRGIRVNCVCPAFADTDMVKEALEHSVHGKEEGKRRLAIAVPMQRLAKIDEVVQAMAWIASDQNSFYTGQALSIDGGLTSF